MASNPKKKQQALKHQRAVARKTVHRKQQAAVRRQTENTLLGGGSPKGMLRASGAWPLQDALLTEDWETPAELVQILVARRGPQGQVAVGTFLVDLACLGVKSAFGRVYPSRYEYEELRDGMTGRQAMVQADLNLIARIVRAGIDYARDLGFEPDPDYRDAIPVLGDADPDASPVPIPLGGPNGKPCFIAGPHDNSQLIMAKLTRRLGPTGFDYIAEVDPDSEFLRGIDWEQAEVVDEDDGDE